MSFFVPIKSVNQEPDKTNRTERAASVSYCTEGSLETADSQCVYPRCKTCYRRPGVKCIYERRSSYRRINRWSSSDEVCSDNEAISHLADASILPRCTRAKEPKDASLQLSKLAYRDKLSGFIGAQPDANKEVRVKAKVNDELNVPMGKGIPWGFRWTRSSNLLSEKPCQTTIQKTPQRSFASSEIKIKAKSPPFISRMRILNVGKTKWNARETARVTRTELNKQWKRAQSEVLSSGSQPLRFRDSEHSLSQRLPPIDRKSSRSRKKCTQNLATGQSVMRTAAETENDGHERADNQTRFAAMHTYSGQPQVKCNPIEYTVHAVIPVIAQSPVIQGIRINQCPVSDRVTVNKATQTPVTMVPWDKWNLKTSVPFTVAGDHPASSLVRSLQKWIVRLQHESSRRMLDESVWRYHSKGRHDEDGMISPISLARAGNISLPSPQSKSIDSSETCSCHEKMDAIREQLDLDPQKNNALPILSELGPLSKPDKQLANEVDVCVVIKDSATMEKPFKAKSCKKSASVILFDPTRMYAGGPNRRPIPIYQISAHGPKTVSRTSCSKCALELAPSKPENASCHAILLGSWSTKPISVHLGAFCPQGYTKKRYAVCAAERDVSCCPVTRIHMRPLEPCVHLVSLHKHRSAKEE